MAFNDIREFISKLEEEGELKRVKAEVDQDQELAAVMRKIQEADGPACLFENMKGTKFRMLSGAFYGHKKYALAIGAAPNLKALLDKLYDALLNPIDPVMVSTGACKENIETGDEIDLYKFPAPKWFHQDGGRYIGTLGCIVTKDPDTGISNIAINRWMISDKVTLAGLLTQHSGLNYAKWKALGKAMPWAMAIGVPPAVLAVATTRTPYPQDKYAIAGGLLGAPLPLVKCETVDLEVPANCEVVIEGEAPLDHDHSTWRNEGPFGEFAGYCSQDKPEPRPSVHVTAVTYRNDAIFQGCSPGIPPNEETSFREIGATVGALNNIKRTGVPGIKDLYCPPMACAEFQVVISLERQFYLGHAREVIAAAFAAVKWCKWVIVVDDDIDIHDAGQVQWALMTRVQPHRDIIIGDERYSANPADPSVPTDLREDPTLARGSRMGIDATRGFKGYAFPDKVESTPEMKQLVEKRWREYGFSQTTPGPLTVSAKSPIHT
jgi:4-hydroxy-3-polyprenylbenzoate decarboxylase